MKIPSVRLLPLGFVAFLAFGATASADPNVPVVSPPVSPLAPRPAAPPAPRWASMSCVDIMNQVWGSHGWQSEQVSEVFPYAMERHYQRNGVKLREFQLIGLPVRIEVDLTFEMCSQANWPVLLKTLGLPADTPSPLSGTRIDQAKLNPADGNKATWYAVDLSVLNEQEVKSPSPHTTAAVLLMGDRLYFKDVNALLTNQVNEIATAKVIGELFSVPAGGVGLGSAPIVPVNPVGPVLPTSDKR